MVGAPLAVGVTKAAGTLQPLGLITYRRAELAVLGHSGREAAACSCYGADHKGCAQQIGDAPAAA